MPSPPTFPAPLDRQRAVMVAATLTGALMTEWVLVAWSAPRDATRSPAVGALWVALAVVSACIASWLAGLLGRRGVRWPDALIAAAVTLWCGYRGAVELTGPAPFTAWIEFALACVLVAGLVGLALEWRAGVLRELAAESGGVDRDPLTGLVTRRVLLEHLARLTSADHAALCVLDLNDLNILNEQAGHAVGDVQIRAAARALKEVLPPHAVIARWAGDQFAALLPGVAEREAHALAIQANRVAPRLRQERAAFTVGIAAVKAGEPIERVIAVAEQRMHDDKATVREDDLYRTGADTTTVSLDVFTRRLELLSTPQEVLDVGLGLARHLLGYDSASYHERRGEAFVVTWSRTPDDLPAPPNVARSVTVPEGGLVALAVTENTTVWTSDYASDPRAMPDVVREGLKSAVLTPVRDAGYVVAVIALTSYRTWRSTPPEARRLLEAVALRLGHVLERQRVVEQVRRTLEGGLLGLGIALEARDLETTGHTQRVVQHSMTLGRALGLPAEQLESLRQGAYLHDIGKLAIPDAILLKPGQLTGAEWSIMQSHAERGHEMACRIGTLPPGALSVIRHHHERWDGTGYPAGLEGDAIPFLARIFAVCDVYDALTSARPYKQAWRDEDARAEIQRLSGVQFDPRIVRAFLAVLPPLVANAPTGHE